MHVYETYVEALKHNEDQQPLVLKFIEALPRLLWQLGDSKYASIYIHLYVYVLTYTHLYEFLYLLYVCTYINVKSPICQPCFFTFPPSISASCTILDTLRSYFLSKSCVLPRSFQSSLAYYFFAFARGRRVFGPFIKV